MHRIGADCILFFTDPIDRLDRFIISLEHRTLLARAGRATGLIRYTFTIVLDYPCF